MSNIHRILPRRRATGAAGVLIVAALVTGVYFASHSPAAGEGNATAPAAHAAQTAQDHASSQKGEAPFVYFPSQYELNAPEPGEPIQAF